MASDGSKNSLLVLVHLLRRDETDQNFYSRWLIISHYIIIII